MWARIFSPCVKGQLAAGLRATCRFREKWKHHRTFGLTKKGKSGIQKSLQRIKTRLVSVFSSAFVCAHKAQRSSSGLTANVSTERSFLAHHDPPCPRLSFSTACIALFPTASVAVHILAQQQRQRSDHLAECADPNLEATSRTSAITYSQQLSESNP